MGKSPAVGGAAWPVPLNNRILSGISNDFRAFRRGSEAAAAARCIDMKAKRIAYLIHSMIYSTLAARDPRVLRDTNAGIYLERERLCERRWRAAIRQLEPDALYAQLAGGSELLAWARQQLGEARVIEPRAEWRDGKEIEVYRRELSDSFLAQLAGKGHELDLETTRLESLGGVVHRLRLRIRNRPCPASRPENPAVRRLRHDRA